jgi:hypothetical protein
LAAGRSLDGAAKGFPVVAGSFAAVILGGYEIAHLIALAL